MQDLDYQSEECTKINTSFSIMTLFIDLVQQ